MILKVCGITRGEDARHAVEHGATALGFIFWPKSPRYVEPERAAAIIEAVPDEVTTVGVFVNEAVETMRRIVDETGLSMIQLHGDETPDQATELPVPIVRSMTLADAGTVTGAWPSGTTFLLDAADPVRRGGTGVVVDWKGAAEIAAVQRVILAGGLTPSTVAEAIDAVRPYGVDVSSGVEEMPGVKDPAKVAAFLASARAAFGKQR